MMHVAKLPYGVGPLVRKFVYAYMPMWLWFRSLKWLYGHQPTVQSLDIDLGKLSMVE